MRCALVSSSLDLRGYLGAEFAGIADRIEIVDHRRSGFDADIPLAIAWHPPDDAFERYPNLQAVCSIGAGVDNIIACPSLRPEIEVVRIVDPAQAQMMSGFVVWHVIWHQRRFKTYLDHNATGSGSVSANVPRKTSRSPFSAMARSARKSPQISHRWAFRSWYGAAPRSRRRLRSRAFTGVRGSPPSSAKPKCW
jgi:hypothetical protein